MRKLSITLAVVSALAPIGASALGIGDIRLRSSLNQTLNAEIPLVTSGTESITDVKVSLASPEAFNKAGVERHFALSKLRFTPTQKPDGSYVIKVSSQEVIREPFLNFLVEVNWPQGRMLREFTVLLDPPSTFVEETVPTTELAETTRQTRRPSYARPEEEIFPRRSSVGERTTTASAERISGATYGPVRPDETLWSIAKLISQDVGATHEQVMTALYQANPQAFIRNNIHGLKAGEKLTIPSRETILSIPTHEAKAHIRPSPPPKKGKLAEQRPEQVAETTAEGQVTGGQLKLLAPTEVKEKQVGGIPGAKEEGGKTKGDIALEVADTVKQENEEIRSRLTELEQQLSSMQRLLTLKDEQIAGLQGQQKPAGAPLLPTTVPAASPEPEKAEAITPSPLASVPGAATTAPQPTPAAPELKPEKIPVAPPSPAAVQPLVKRPQPVPQPTEEPGILAEILDEPLLLGLAGVTSALLLGILAWLTIRRRAAIMDEAESILSPNVRDRIPETPTPPPIMEGVPTEHIVVSAKSSFLSEFTPSDFDALGSEADEVDPISEADVYLAYGRYKQAEDLIRGAIAQHPERDECKLKLLEIHYATENRTAFEKYANELFTAGKDADPDFWEKVTEMGRELCPGSGLFAKPQDVKLEADESAYLNEQLLDDRGGSGIEDDFIAELKRFEESQRKSEPAQGSHLASFDFEEKSNGAKTAEKTPEAEDRVASLDFDFTPPSAVVDKKTPPTRDDQEPTADLENLIAFEPGVLETASLQEAVSPARDKSLDDILMELGAKSPTDKQPQEPATGEEPLEFTFDLELPDTTTPGKPEAPPSASPAAISGEGDDLYSSLTDMDEQETKLDLAKAYIDMGDEATAREIIEDILVKGNAAQKDEATALLAKIGKSA